MTIARTTALSLVVAAAFAGGVAVGLRLNPPPRDQTRAVAPERIPSTPTDGEELAATLAKASALYQRDDLRAAAAHYEAATRYAPADVDLRLKTARLYCAIGQWWHAVPHLKAAIRAEPDRGEPYLAMARILADRGRGLAPQAKALAMKAAELGQPIPDALLQELDKLERENERAKQEGRPHPDGPLSGLDDPLVLPHLQQRDSQ